MGFLLTKFYKNVNKIKFIQNDSKLQNEMLWLLDEKVAEFLENMIHIKKHVDLTRLDKYSD